MGIYSGTVEDVTEEILWTWLQREVLRGAVELHAGEDNVQKLGCTIADPTNPAARQHYLLTIDQAATHDDAGDPFVARNHAGRAGARCTTRRMPERAATPQCRRQ